MLRFLSEATLRRSKKLTVCIFQECKILFYWLSPSALKVHENFMKTHPFIVTILYLGLARVPPIANFHQCNSSSFHWFVSIYSCATALCFVSGDKAKIQKMVQMAWTFINDRSVQCFVDVSYQSLECAVSLQENLVQKVSLIMDTNWTFCCIEKNRWKVLFSFEWWLQRPSALQGFIEDTWSQFKVHTN